MGVKGLTISPILCNGMILQRDAVNLIYGSDMEAAYVTVYFQDSQYSAQVDAKHDFCIELPPIQAGGPYRLIIKGSSEITIDDVLFGDVYILSGQSNMELPVRRVLDVSANEIESIYETDIRQYLIPAAYNFKGPEKYVQDRSWKKAEGEDLLSFSAAGLFFAKELRESHQIPIGLIMTAVGGCGVESWMKPATLSSFGDYEKSIRAFWDIEYFHAYIREQQNVAARWIAKLEEEDKNKIEEDRNKNSILSDYRNWDTCKVPSLFSDYHQGTFQGSIYLCREVDLKEEPVTEDSSYIYMGSIIDSDRIWINNEEVGRTEYQYPPRKYRIKNGILKKGTNIITVRIVINNGNGGTIKNKPYLLHYNNQTIELEGDWYYRIGSKAESPIPEVLFPPTLPICFYNTVVAPLSRTALKGILWYQGEQNTSAPKNYADKFKAMVSDWRELYGWEVPFIFVQLPNYRGPLNNSEDTGWAELREQQRQCLTLPKTAMVTTLDIGEANDLHPQNKKAVGVRLAHAARSLIYNEDVIYSGPIPHSATIAGRTVKILFDYLEDLESEFSIRCFELAGIDGDFCKALAIRKGKYVYVSSEQVLIPRLVRYAWSDNPEEINFFNEAGLPAAGFRLELLRKVEDTYESSI